MEQTLVILKPDAVQRGLVGEVIARFEKVGLRIVGLKMVQPDRKHYHEHYEGISQLITRWGDRVYETVLAHMTNGPVVAMVVEGIEAVYQVRKMVGPLDPKESQPGTIRGDYTHLTRDHANSNHLTLPNIVHASGDPQEAKKEINLWFKKNELYDYELPHQVIIRGKKPS